MKKLIALLLVTLMALPFAVVASAAAAPAEPAVTATTKVYVGWGGAGNKTGADAANFITTSGWVTDGAFHNLVKDGGTVVVVGKSFAAATTDFSATTSPVVFTAKDGDTDYTSKNPDGTIQYMDESGNNAGQLGMFMIADGSTMTFKSDVIFDNIVILNRLSANAVSSGKACGTFKVADGSKLVIKDSVQFAKMSGNVMYSLDVEEGGYAYLHAAGFEDYTGKGTIVLDRALVTSGKVTKDTFKNFEGSIIAQDGSDPFTAPAPGPIPTGDMTWVVAAVASIAVMGCAVAVAKKRAN